MTKEQLERYLAAGMSLGQIGKRVGRSPSTVSYHLRKHGLVPVNRGRHANKGPIPAEVLRELAETDMSLRQMSSELDRSPSTVRYWLRRYGLRSRGMGLRRPELEQARRAGLRRVESSCAHHGMTMFILEGRGYYRCMKCRQSRVSEWRRRAKRRLIAHAGGSCQLCGYDRCQGALQFHHLDPGEKRFSISREGVTRSFAELLAEAEKCVLLCANCHAEVEGGVRAVGAEAQGETGKE